MIYGYARVSTIHQYLESQIQALQQEGCDKIFQDKLTGTNKNRPQLVQLLDMIQEGDTLIVTKLDRLARSALDGIETIRELFEKGVRVHILNMGLVEDTPTGRLIFNVMLAFAEFERDMIVERTQEGKAMAKKDPNYSEGRPKRYKKDQIEHALQLKKSYTYRQVEAKTGISKSTLIRAKRERSII